MTEEKIPKLQFGMFLKIDGFVRLNTRMKKVKVISKSIHLLPNVTQQILLCILVSFHMPHTGFEGGEIAMS